MKPALAVSVLAVAVLAGCDDAKPAAPDPAAPPATRPIRPAPTPPPATLPAFVRKMRAEHARREKEHARRQAIIRADAVRLLSDDRLEVKLSNVSGKDVSSF